MTRPVALFDFDGTLTRYDTLGPFVAAVIGPARFAIGVAVCLPSLIGLGIGLARNDRVKERVFRHALAGRRIDDLAEAGRAFARDEIPRRLRADTMAILARHRAEGRRLILVSASLDLYLEPWAATAGFDEVLATRLAVGPDGRVDGRLDGANCHGEEKVRRIRAVFDRDGGRPEHVVAYGDSAGDLPMLRFADEGWRVRGTRFARLAG